MGATFPAVIQRRRRGDGRQRRQVVDRRRTSPSASARRAGPPVHRAQRRRRRRGRRDDATAPASDKQGRRDDGDPRTGIGTAVFVDGSSCPTPSSATSRSRQGGREPGVGARPRAQGVELDAKWGKRLDAYFRHARELLNPDLFIVGGGVEQEVAPKFFGFIQTRAESCRRSC